MTVRESFFRGVARQLGRPTGAAGRLIAVMLNRGNRGAIGTAIDLAEVRLDGDVADLGFGGGIGLGMLMSRVGHHGHVTGVDLSADMVARARRTYRDEIATARMAIVAGSLTDLPLPDASIDAAITVNTVYFVRELDALAAELHRVLRPGGRVVIAMADPKAVAGMPFTSYGFIVRPIDSVVSPLVRVGLTVGVDRGGPDPVAAHFLVARR